MKYSDEPLRALVADMLRQTIREARAEPPFGQYKARGKCDAVIWLASRHARPWFEFVEISQGRALRHLGWVDLARDVLAMDVVLDRRERRMLEDAIERFERYGSDGRKAG